MQQTCASRVQTWADTRRADVQHAPAAALYYTRADMRQTCFRHAPYMHQTCNSHATAMQQARARHAPGMRQTCAARSSVASCCVLLVPRFFH
eukprot:15449767-Alexandrium_andersonii.AAC.1